MDACSLKEEVPTLTPKFAWHITNKLYQQYDYYYQVIDIYQCPI